MEVSEAREAAAWARDPPADSRGGEALARCQSLQRLFVTLVLTWFCCRATLLCSVLGAVPLAMAGTCSQ
eukprot:2751188-Rhodomonas_salina.1